MSIVAHDYHHVVGVDTHAKSHTFAIVETHSGALHATAQFPTSPAGLRRSLTWVTNHTTDHSLLVVEGVGSYGATLATLAISQSWTVVEPSRMPARQGSGKTDEIDAERIARSVLGIDTTRLRKPRSDNGIRDCLRVLVNARDMMNTERTQTINALTALVRTIDLGIDARSALSASQITMIAQWRTRGEPLDKHIARTEATRLATRIQGLTTDLKTNETHIRSCVHASPAACLLNLYGIGPICAAIIFLAWGYHDRIHSGAAFTALAGASPIPASSGNTHHHRLNRHGDRRLNRALTVITNTRMRSHEPTRDYVNKRTAEGLTHRNIKRILKCYIARHVYRQLQAQPI